MSNKPRIELLISESIIDLETQKSVWSSYWREVRNDLLASFLIVGLVSSGFAWFFLNLFSSMEHISVVAICLGLGCGAIFVAYLTSKEWRHFYTLWSDLRNGKCEVLTVGAERAIAVDLQNGQHAIAFDCGQQTVLLVGDWWKNQLRTDIVWGDDEQKRRFPSANFEFSRLPRSGRVFEVRSVGARIRVMRKKPIEPELSVIVDNFVDSWVVNNPIGTLFCDREEIKGGSRNQRENASRESS